MTGIERIRQVIPHRFPMLLVDRVHEVEPGVRIVAHKAVSGTESCYAELGEQASDTDYAYPLSRVLESWAQAAVLLARWERPNPDVTTGLVELLAGLRDVELSGTVFPGHVLVHEVRLVRELSDAAVFTGSTSVNDVPVARIGQLTMARRAAELLRPERSDQR